MRSQFTPRFFQRRRVLMNSSSTNILTSDIVRSMSVFCVYLANWVLLCCFDNRVGAKLLYSLCRSDDIMSGIAEGNRIQASVLSRHLLDQFRDFPVEGETYFIANFIVSSNNNQYRGTNNPFKITFTQQTYIKPQDGPIPINAYSFTPIAEVLKCTERTCIDYLIDVIAFVQSIGLLEEYRKENDTKHKLRMVLVDNEENDIECVLFDECSTDAYANYLENMETLVVVVINLARVGFAEDGRPQLCSSFSATRVFFNPCLQEVKDLIANAKQNSSPVMTALTQPIPTQSGQPSADNMMRNNTRVVISEIGNQRIDATFIIICVIMKLETRHGWTYDCCSKCGSKPKMEDGSWYCMTCKKKPESIEPKLKVHYVVEDESGKTSVIFWDKLAVQLFNKNATEMKVLLQKAQCEYDFPDSLDELVGKRMILKLKLNDYNKRYPSSSISVLQYTICEDLIEQFIHAAIENQVPANDNPAEDEVCNDDDPTTELNEVRGEDPRSPEVEISIPTQNINESAYVEGNIASPVQSAQVEIDSNADDMTLSQLSDSMKAPPTKGKRKGSGKRVAALEVSKTINTPSSSVPEDRVVKVIKQEKK
ncbi:replication protein A 70 kDa DNA-binding subunit A-like isoform X2 [Neltuma alba]|uniref:replication protein A 70 kDa DNA-binding subunit A-like isoform X2 n=1 Tax=Neltuma alba TaxID=207710 RepID=UPI0010A475A8|nr:replication protein A 70 kDa DNA-binding subunit A-like isoform X2 [Prosopis alba]